MMHNFSYVKAGSLSEAIKALGAKGAWIHAGGTDLLGCALEEIIQVDKVVSISGLKQLKGIAADSGGGLKIAALTPVADVARHAEIGEKYAVLAQAAASVGSPQLREQGTVGGNLCQRPRCWYFRSKLQCRKKGGSVCYAMGGENQYHAVFGGGPCFFVHPSDIAVALSALEARISISGPSGSKVVKIDDFFVSPRQNVEKENILLQGEVVTHIQIPAPGVNARSSYRKVAERKSWDFALASAATVLHFENDRVRTARIVLGGVAPYPWRAAEAEKALAGGKLDEEAAAEAADAAIAGAAPLRDNAYKLEIVKSVVRESLMRLSRQV